MSRRARRNAGYMLATAGVALAGVSVTALTWGLGVVIGVLLVVVGYAYVTTPHWRDVRDGTV